MLANGMVTEKGDANPNLNAKPRLKPTLCLWNLKKIFVGHSLVLAPAISQTLKVWNSPGPRLNGHMAKIRMKHVYIYPYCTQFKVPPLGRRDPVTLEWPAHWFHYAEESWNMANLSHWGWLGPFWALSPRGTSLSSLCSIVHHSQNESGHRRAQGHE